MFSNNFEYDAIVIGAGPNGLAAAITLRQRGISVLLLEGKEKIGGGMATEELTLPGFRHDVASAVHPMAAASPFFQSLALDIKSVHFIKPELQLAHAFDGGSAAFVSSSIMDTADQFGQDKQTYIDLIGPIVAAWPEIGYDLLGPLRFPKHFNDVLKFGLKGIMPALSLAKRFKTEKARGLIAGLATHNFNPLNKYVSSAIPLVMLANAHLRGWPIIQGGSEKLAEALGKYFVSIGGTIETGHYVSDLSTLPSTRAILFDLTPRQLLALNNTKFSRYYRWQLAQYQYGSAVYKIDWALNNPIPFTASECRRAGTIHLGNTLEEINAGENQIARGGYSDNPFVLISQPSIFDPSRSPSGFHTAYGYCHVPNGSTQNMTDAIENQVERFAPGFKKMIVSKHTMNTVDLEGFNSNLVGGDINAGSIQLNQLFTRPVFRFPPYRTSVKGWYMCSASTPPGGGVHGMCGYHAARTALSEVFDIKVTDQ